MTETTQLRSLLLPELESEFHKTRKLLANIPEGQTAFTPHDKSMPLSKLAGHTAHLPEFITIILTSPDVDLAATGMTPVVLTTVPQLLATYDELVDKALTAFKSTSDQTFEQNWTLSYKGHTIFKGSRYAAYREMGVNHMIHHRAQLGVYLRLLNAPVPGTFGPSADEPLAF